MGGFDEHATAAAGIMGDWMPPSPSPRSFFSAILGYDTGSRSVVSEPPKDDDNNNSGFSFPGPDKPENGEASSRSGLVERMAARAGYNAPRLNTDIVKPCAQSPYLTIPPGLSPTSLLDSPVFLSNSLVQPSPTTGKFPFAPNANGNMTFSHLNTSSFAFKPVPESAPTSGAPVKVDPPFMAWQSFPSIENRFPPQSIKADKVHENSDLSNKLTSQINNEKEHHDEDADQVTSSEDGYNWRKYGQKQVKGSEYPRSYYKCTHPNCPVKKKVERSHKGHITEIIYKGAHSHPKPPPTRRSGIGSSTNGDLEVTSSTMDRHGPSGSQFESSDAVDGSLTFSNDEEEEEEDDDDDDGATHGSISLGYDGEGDESESKRRKMEAYAADVSGGNRGIREPRVVVQTTSEVDILDDGYRWRKYGQKVVKGNPNPRSYYKCTSTGCTVRKHVERASHDLKSVITTYEGKHNHDVPPARNNNNNNHHSQIQNRIESRHDAYAYAYGGSGSGTGMEGKMPTIPHHHQYMLPKGEPVSDPASLYHHQIINNTFLPHI